MNLPKPLSRSERRKARTTAAILDAAERHLLLHGYESARVDEIAADADVAVGSIYNHFGSKEGLYAALAERAVDLHRTFMEEGRETGLSPLERLLDVAGRLARFGREHPGKLRLLALAGADAPSEVGESVHRHLADQERRTAALIEAAVRTGEARRLNSRHAAAFLWSAWLGLLTSARHAPAAGDRALRGAIETGLRIVVGGVASEGARESSDVVRALLDGAPAPAAEPAAPRRSLERLPAARELRADFAGLAVWAANAAATPGPTPSTVASRLGQLASVHGRAPRVTAASASGIAPESTPWAYRVFARRAGLDPDAAPSPAAAIALHGPVTDAGASGQLLEDALTLVALETGVPLVAVDAGTLAGRPYARMGDAAELGAAGLPASDAPIVADESGPVAVLLGAVAPGRAPGPRTERLTLLALQVKGVPDVGVQEALWTAVEVLESA
ncbi:MAG TPA: TetR/AcrR family transcriptional regulator [Thermoleophilaceae bacterium]|nr:TetR/AcrR family transcriptional regulator [Thermoleophilaceae bacterium]